MTVIGKSAKGSSEALTLADMDRCYSDGRWLGYGYGGEIGAGLGDGPDASERWLAGAHRAVIRAANAEGLTYEELFDWFNSKMGRWAAEDLNGCRDMPRHGATQADRVALIRRSIQAMRDSQARGTW